MDKDKEIKCYIDYITRHYTITGCLVCGSYVNGTYTVDSDLDILFIVPGHRFEMKLEIYKNVLFDRIVVDDAILYEIITSHSAIGDILSYSLGSSQKIIIPDDPLDTIINQCRANICKNNIMYKKPESKPKKIVDGKIFTIQKKANSFFLFKDDKIVI